MKLLYVLIVLCIITLFSTASVPAAPERFFDIYIHPGETFYYYVWFGGKQYEAEIRNIEYDLVSGTLLETYMDGIRYDSRRVSPYEFVPEGLVVPELYGLYPQRGTIELNSRIDYYNNGYKTPRYRVWLPVMER